MFTKIKNVLKKVTVVEWVILGVAVLALLVSFAPKGNSDHKASHGGVKHSEKASVEAPK